MIALGTRIFDKFSNLKLDFLENEVFYKKKIVLHFSFIFIHRNVNYSSLSRLELAKFKYI